MTDPDKHHSLMKARIAGLEAENEALKSMLTIAGINPSRIGIREFDALLREMVHARNKIVTTTNHIQYEQTKFEESRREDSSTCQAAEI